MALKIAYSVLMCR